MARTKQSPIQSKYSLTPLYGHTNDKIDRSRCRNYVPHHARLLARYRARKAEWETNNPGTPYPHQPPQPDGRRGAAARKFPYPTH